MFRLFNKKDYIIQSLCPDMTLFWGFKWPKKGKVVDPDWNLDPYCKGVVLGSLNGERGLSNLDWSIDCVWCVAEVDKKKGIELKGAAGGSWKFPKAKVVFSGNRKDATDFLLSKIGWDKPVEGCYKIGGYKSNLLGGNHSTLSAGSWSEVFGKDNSTVNTGDFSVICVGKNSTVNGGEDSQVSAGDRSILQVKYHYGNRHRVAVGYVGEDALKPNTYYKVNNEGKFVETTCG